MWQDSWLEPGRRRRIFDRCSSSDQLSWLGKIPDLAGGSIFYGPMAKRKRSRVSLPSMTRSSGLLSTLTRGRGTRTQTLFPDDGFRELGGPTPAGTEMDKARRICNPPKLVCRARRRPDSEWDVFASTEIPRLVFVSTLRFQQT